MSDLLREEIEEGIVLVTLNRPERLDALSQRLIAGLHQAFAALAAWRVPSLSPSTSIAPEIVSPQPIGCMPSAAAPQAGVEGAFEAPFQLPERVSTVTA
jgi:hypothetical protein